MIDLKEKLLEKYENTGKIGFYKPQTKEEALNLIECLCSVPVNESMEVLSITELIQRIKTVII